MESFKLNLGSEVKDVFSGLIGLIRGRSQYLTGCNTYGVQPSGLNKDGNEPNGWTWFDEHQLILLKDKKIDPDNLTNTVKVNKVTKKGGVRSSNHSAPSRN